MTTPAPSSGGNVPTVPKAQFNAAQAGKVSEAKRPAAVPEQVQKAANDVVAEQNKSNTNEITLAGKKARLTYNVNAHGVPTNKTTQHQPPEALKPYTSKETGTTYKTKAAIEAAKNLDHGAKKTRDAEQRQAGKANVTKHHAPAPTPQSVARNPNRGRSTSQSSQTAVQAKPKTEREQLTNYQARVIAAAQAKQNQQPGQVKEHSNTQQMER
jgi:hypothetical protein